MAGGVVLFGPFEFNRATGELKKHDVPLSLQGHPRMILEALLERPGEPIQREVLKKRLWGEDQVHVDFEAGLNAAMNRLRKTLGEEYGNHIKTKRGEGYRFDVVVREKAAEKETPDKDHPRHTRASGLRIAVLAAAAIPAFVLLGRWAETDRTISVARITPLTNDGRAKSPYLATDGQRVYLGEMANRSLRLLQVGASGGAVTEAADPFAGEWPDAQDVNVETGRVLVRSDSGLAEWSPVSNAVRRISHLNCESARWSPDRRTIACAAGGTLSVLGADGGQLRTLHKTASIQALAWTPDGRKIRYSARERTGERLGLREITLENGADAAVKVGTDDEAIAGVYLRDAWVYVSSRDHNVYATRGSGGKPQMLTNGPVQFYSLATDGSGDTLYAMGQSERGELLRYDVRAESWRPYLEARSADCLAWSPDGAWVAYVSYPGRELWRAKVDGSDSLQLTAAPVQAYHPNWSPDGSKIAYEAKTDRAGWRVWTVDRNGGSPQEITPGMMPELQQREPVWSPDGRTIVFTTMPDASPENDLALYSVDLNTRHIRRLPGSDELLSPRWAPDGSGLLALDKRNAIVFYEWTSGAVRVLTDGHKGWPHWTRNAERVCFLDGRKQAMGCVGRGGGAVQWGATVPFTLTGNTFSGSWDSNFWAGFIHDDTPVVLKNTGQAEVYRMLLVWR